MWYTSLKEDGNMPRTTDLLKSISQYTNTLKQMWLSRVDDPPSRLPFLALLLFLVPRCDMCMVILPKDLQRSSRSSTCPLTEL
jgi:hypothetical protein